MANRSPSSRSPERPIVVRKMGFCFDDVPKHWFADNAFLTHFANGLHLVFPAGERFFIRAVKHYIREIDDPELLERVRGFFGQEGSHGHEHERSFEMLESHGFEVRSFLRWYEQTAFEKVAPKFSPLMRLSVTVALEHFTATLAEQGLTTEILDHAHPVMRDLLRWHAAEEIEHKAVTFDVLQAVDPRYRVRIAGLVLATFGLIYFWNRGTQSLLAQEPDLRGKKLAQQRKAARALGLGHRFLVGAIVSYLRPGFHPDQNDNHHLSRAYLSKVGRLAA